MGLEAAAAGGNQLDGNGLNDNRLDGNGLDSNRLGGNGGGWQWA